MEPIWVNSYPPGVPATYDFPKVPVTRLLDDAAARFPDRTAIEFHGNTVSYARLAEQVDLFASALREMGVSKGTTVGTLTPNVPQMVVAFFATLRLGGIIVCNNPLYTERELEHQINDSGVEVLLVLDLMYPKIAAIRDRCPKLREVIVCGVFDNFSGVKAFLGPRLKKDAWLAIPSTEPVRRWKDVMRGAPGGVAQEPLDTERDLALLQYTGGTTGVSKGVMLTHANIVSNCYQAKLWLQDLKDGEETVMCALPLFHSYGQTMCMNVGVFTAATLVLEPNPRDAGGLLATVRRTKPTIFPGVPTLYQNLLAHPDLGKTDMRSVRLCASGAAPLPVEVQERWEQVTGGRLVEGYGLSETSPLASCNPLYGKRKVGTIGLPVTSTEFKLVDVDDPSKDVPAPGPGELCIRGPQVMRGYWQKKEETDEVLIDGWLHTGDVAEIDEDGFFRIVDRKKDMILVGGFNVYPRDIEEVIYQHPKVLECAVIGIPASRSGETVKAFIAPKPGESISEAEIDGFLRERLTGYKIPKEYEFRTELPKSMIGKVLRKELRADEKKKAAGA